MTDTITLTGVVATPPRDNTTNANLAITSFRLASTQRRFDRAQNKWVDAETNWYTISAFRQLATNALASIQKGDRILVSGRLRIRDWQSGDKSGMNVDVEADSLGHDLTWGTAQWVRTSSGTAQRAEREEPHRESTAFPPSAPQSGALEFVVSESTVSASAFDAVDDEISYEMERPTSSGVVAAPF